MLLLQPSPMLCHSTMHSILQFTPYHKPSVKFTSTHVTFVVHTPPLTHPMSQHNSPSVSSVAPVCVDDGLVAVTLRAIGSRGVLVRWQQTCASSTLRFRDTSTNGAETSISLSSNTSLFFLSQSQLTAGSEYQVCVDMLCGDVICSGCSSVHTGP